MEIPFPVHIVLQRGCVSQSLLGGVSGLEGKLSPKHFYQRTDSDYKFPVQLLITIYKNTNQPNRRDKYGSAYLKQDEYIRPGCWF